MSDTEDLQPAIALPLPCLVCMRDTPVNACSLQCQHVFCKACLKLYLIMFEPGHRVTCTLCPTCGLVTNQQIENLPELSLIISPNLQKPSEINDKNTAYSQECHVCGGGSADASEFFCSKCSMNLCNSCKSCHDDHPLMKSHTTVLISTMEMLHTYCQRHRCRQNSYFCTDCQLPLCPVCVLQDHSQHKTVKLREAVSAYREKLKVHLTFLRPVLNKVETLLKESNAMQNGNLSGCSCSLAHQGERDSPTGCNPQRYKGDVSMSLITFHVQHIRKLYDWSVKALEMSCSSKFHHICSILLSRLKILHEHDIGVLEKSLRLDKIARKCLDVETYKFRCSSSTVGHNSLSMISIEPPEIEEEPNMLIHPSQLWKTEKGVHESNEIRNPCAASFFPNGNLVVAEYDGNNEKNNHLRIFDRDGEVLECYSDLGIRPLGVAVNREGQMLVTDCCSKRVKVYTETGQLFAEMGKGMFGWCHGICVSSKGQVIVSDVFNDTITIFKPDGKKYKQIGSSGFRSTQFNNPFYVTVDLNDNILVSDNGNTCVKIFSADGQFIRKIRKFPNSDVGAPKGKSWGPRGICTTQQGYVLVAEQNRGVSIFSPSYEFTRRLLSPNDHARSPEAVCCSSSGRLAVTECGDTNAVSVFNLF